MARSSTTSSRCRVLAELLNVARKPVNGSTILLLAVAYTRDIADMRESPALPLLQRLAAKGADVR
jgi:UDP-N-acetyl-D-glucosamine dehydrogenase